MGAEEGVRMNQSANNALHQAAGAPRGTAAPPAADLERSADIGGENGD
jgi:hypothetical protein